MAFSSRAAITVLIFLGAAFPLRAHRDPVIITKGLEKYYSFLAVLEVWFSTPRAQS
jgi:hypothetical protein